MNNGEKSEGKEYCSYDIFRSQIVIMLVCGKYFYANMSESVCHTYGKGTIVIILLQVQ